MERLVNCEVTISQLNQQCKVQHDLQIKGVKVGLIVDHVGYQTIFGNNVKESLIGLELEYCNTLK